MAGLFTAEYTLLWTAVMALALFFPIRRALWRLLVRHAEQDGNEDEERRNRLSKQASAISAMLAAVSSYVYVMWLFGGTGTQ